MYGALQQSPSPSIPYRTRGLHVTKSKSKGLQTCWYSTRKQRFMEHLSFLFLMAGARGRSVIFGTRKSIKKESSAEASRVLVTEDKRNTIPNLHFLAISLLRQIFKVGRRDLKCWKGENRVYRPFVRGLPTSTL